MNRGHGALHPGARRLCARGAFTHFPIVNQPSLAREARENIWARRQELGLLRAWPMRFKKKHGVTPLWPGTSGGQTRRRRVGGWKHQQSNNLGLNLPS